MLEALWLLAVIHLYLFDKGRKICRQQYLQALQETNQWLKKATG